VTRAISGSLRTEGTAAIDAQALDRLRGEDRQQLRPGVWRLGGAPKFPPSMALDFLMQAAWRGAPGSDQEYRASSSIH